MSQNKSIPVVLTIAGSDSSAGAGIQADIKAISATGGYGCSVITAVTSQNTMGVFNILPLPIAHIASQLDAVFSDLNVTTVKIGMVANSDIMNLIADKLEFYAPKYIVLDPVMVATSGDRLLEAKAIDTLKRRLLPLADLITPNIPEAKVLTGFDQDILYNNPSVLLEWINIEQCNAMLLKGGHSSDQKTSDDWLISDQETVRFSSPRIATANTHGTGCSLSSAIACYLAQGKDLSSAVKHGKDYVYHAIHHADSLIIGKGHGPIDHFFMLR